MATFVLASASDSPDSALVTAGVEMKVLGLTHAEYRDVESEAAVHAHPRTDHFKEDIIQTFYDGISNKPETTFCKVKEDAQADKDPPSSSGSIASSIHRS